MSQPRYGDDLIIASRFRGPDRSGNGGYTSGTLAERLRQGPGSVVQVTLRHPPPLDVAMMVQYVDEAGPTRAIMLMGGAPIAEAQLVDEEPEPIEPVPPETADDATGRFSGFASHPFPSCFACGPHRPEGDGLRIFPGAIGDGHVAATWRPHPSLPTGGDTGQVDLGTAWAALDCIGGWAGDIGERRMVLGRMTAQVDALPQIDEPHVVVGRARGQQGRKTFTASTLFDSDGRIVGRAEHTWIAIDPSAFS